MHKFTLDFYIRIAEGDDEINEVMDPIKDYLDTLIGPDTPLYAYRNAAEEPVDDPEEEALAHRLHQFCVEARDDYRAAVELLQVGDRVMLLAPYWGPAPVYVELLAGAVGVVTAITPDTIAVQFDPAPEPSPAREIHFMRHGAERALLPMMPRYYGEEASNV